MAMAMKRKPDPDAGAAALATPTDLKPRDVEKVAAALNGLLADAYVLYLKTKNFHWHVSGPNFRDIHVMLDEQAADILGSTDELAERVRKLGARTLRSLAEALELTGLKENNEDFVPPHDMLIELMEDNKAVAAAMRKAHKVCDEAGDIASASLIENYVDQTEKRTWFLFEMSRAAGPHGH
ncbi:MAG: DNA starvation/stationary phase protection protein [Methylobacteriaceae bacterium]|nr:DNA starvation/stationary phase protection protein [Methylobacteriaceae bacterium]